MLDGTLKTAIQPSLDRLADRLVSLGVSANSVTVSGMVLGVAGAVAIGWEAYWIALFLIGLSRLADGLDGAVARKTHASDFGGYLDIVLDFLFYGAVPLGFMFADPSNNALPGGMLLLSFYFNGATFLAYGIIAEKRGMKTDQRGSKSIFFTTGLAEASETIAVFALACLFPAWFPVLAWGFAAVCFYTAFARIYLAFRAFG